jgi:hypothetical protein
VHPWWLSLLGVNTNQFQAEAVVNAAGSPNLAQITNGLSWGLNSGIDPALTQNFPPVGELPNQSSLPVHPDLNSGLLRQVVNGELPVGKDITITIPYQSLAEFREVLLELRKRKYQEVQYLDQQIEKLKEKQRDDNEFVGGHGGLEGSFP